MHENSLNGRQQFTTNVMWNIGHLYVCNIRNLATNELIGCRVMISGRDSTQPGFENSYFQLMPNDNLLVGTYYILTVTSLDQTANLATFANRR